MDHHSPIEQEVRVDLESATGVINGHKKGSLDLGLGENQAKTVFTKLCDRLMSLDDHSVKLGVDPLIVNEGSQENSVKVLTDGKQDGETASDFIGNKMGQEKRKKASSAKKPPKPPRPPRGFSLDAADQKLIKELAELAMIKRARIERMKALMQKKASKASSSSSSSNGSLFAILFIIIFFLVILFQGMSCQNLGVTFEGSPQMAQANDNGLIFIRRQLNPSARDSI